MKAIEYERTAVEVNVEISVRRGNDSGDPRRRAKRGGQLLSNRLRRFAQGTRELEGDRDSKIAERPIRRNLDGERRHVRHAELRANGGGNLIVELLLNGANHVWVMGTADRPARATMAFCWQARLRSWRARTLVSDAFACRRHTKDDIRVRQSGNFCHVPQIARPCGR